MIASDFQTMVAALSCALLAVAVWSDVREHRIPNLLVLAILVTGIIAQLVNQGATGIVYALGSGMIGLVAFLPLYARGVMGAGDVKLMSAASTMLPLFGALLAVGLTLVAGMLLAIVAIALRMLDQQGMSWRPGGSASSNGSSLLLIRKDRAFRVPYAAAIAVGCIATLWHTGGLGTLVPVLS